jgi:hypothetical protein
VAQKHHLLIAFKGFVNAVQIVVHVGANALTGYKKVVGYIHFTRRIGLRDGIAELIDERKRLYIANYRQFALPFVGTSKQKIEISQQDDGKNADIQQQLLKSASHHGQK